MLMRFFQVNNLSDTLCLMSPCILMYTFMLFGILKECFLHRVISLSPLLLTFYSPNLPTILSYTLFPNLPSIFLMNISSSIYQFWYHWYHAFIKIIIRTKILIILRIVFLIVAELPK